MATDAPLPNLPLDRGVLIFDGDCGFCSTCVRIAQRILPADVKAVPWQRVPDLGAYGLTPDEAAASVQWVDTLPPEMKKAIQDRRPVVGMDRDMVIAAIGKPERKVREKDAEGNDIEDWIYGQPPSKTMFVRFMGEHVTKIEQFPQ